VVKTLFDTGKVDINLRENHGRLYTSEDSQCQASVSTKLFSDSFEYTVRESYLVKAADLKLRGRVLLRFTAIGVGDDKMITTIGIDSDMTDRRQMRHATNPQTICTIE
jgi:hypothetical protein